MPASRQTIAAAAAHHVPLAAHDVAGMKIVHIRPGLLDFADEFVADRHGDGYGALRPFIPVVNMQIGAADAGPADADQHVVDADGGFGNVFEPKSRLTLTFDQCFHGMGGAGLRPAFSLARIAAGSDAPS